MNTYRVTVMAYDAASGQTERVTLTRQGWTPAESVQNMGPIEHEGRLYREWQVTGIRKVN